MGIFSEYINGNFVSGNHTAERKMQLQRISELRKRPIITYASDVQSDPSYISIDYGDILPFYDQLSNIDGKEKEIDILLETPGGSAEVVEDLVEMVRNKFTKVGVIVPGSAKSAGTIFAMAADEILMSPASSLGPIDAQIYSGGKLYSADAFLKGLAKIVAGPTGYAMILQSISPGEIQYCENAQNLSKTLVANWLEKYKFKFWEKHSSDGRMVTESDKKSRAYEIADILCDQTRWLTHGRSIKLDDFKDMRLQIADYSKNDALYDAITRYYTLLRLSFTYSGIFKIIETPETQIIYSRGGVPGRHNPNPISDPAPVAPDSFILEVVCATCGAVGALQARFSRSARILNPEMLFPADNKIICKACNAEISLLDMRNLIESKLGQPIV